MFSFLGPKALLFQRNLLSTAWNSLRDTSCSAIVDISVVRDGVAAPVYARAVSFLICVRRYKVIYKYIFIYFSFASERRHDVVISERDYRVVINYKWLLIIKRRRFFIFFFIFILPVISSSRLSFLIRRFECRVRVVNDTSVFSKFFGDKPLRKSTSSKLKWLKVDFS